MPNTGIPKENKLLDGAGLSTVLGLIKNKIPTAVSDLENDAGYITSAEAPVTSVNGSTGEVVLYADNISYSATQSIKDKIDDIVTAGGEPNVIETVKVNGTALTPVNKEVDVIVPTKVSDLTNDVGFVTSSVTSGLATLTDLEGYVPTSRTINGKTLTTNITLAATDVGAMSSSHVASTITATDISNWNSKSDFSGSYNDLTDKPTIPAAQIQSDWNQSSTTSLDYIKNKPDLSGYITASALSPYALASSLTSYVAKSDVTPVAGVTGTAIATISGKTIYAPVAEGGIQTETDPVFQASAASGITATDITKWNGITTIVSNVQSDWNATTGASVILNKPTIPMVPTNVSAFTNDANYITSTDLASYNYITASDVAANAPVTDVRTIGYNDSDYNSVLDGTVAKIDLRSYATAQQIAGLAPISSLPVITPTLLSGELIATGTQNGSTYELYAPSYPVQDGTESAGLISDTDWNKLNGIAAGAQVNVQSDWNEADGTSDAFILNKPTIPTAASFTSTYDSRYALTSHTHDYSKVTVAQGPTTGTAIGTITVSDNGTTTTTTLYAPSFKALEIIDLAGTTTALSYPTGESFATIKGYIDSGKVVYLRVSDYPALHHLHIFESNVIQFVETAGLDTHYIALNDDGTIDYSEQIVTVQDGRLVLS